MRRPSTRYRSGACKAVVTGNRAARMAGGIAPSTLMTSAKAIAVAADAGVSVRRKVSSENVLKVIVNCSAEPPYFEQTGYGVEYERLENQHPARRVTA